MSVSFDWDFSEEPGASPPPGKGPSRPTGSRFRLRRALVVLVVLVLVGIPLRSWVVQRLKVAEKRETVLRAVVELELKTIANGDVELFRSLQDPVDPAWQERQVIRFISRDGDRFSPAPGLQPSNRVPEIEKIHFFGRSGRVELARWFEDTTQLRSDATSWPSAPLPFHVTWFYRLDDDGNWYHVEPPGDYWGIPYSWHGNRLTVRATEVESERIDRVARELAVLVYQGCLLMGCPEDRRFILSFEDVPAAQVRGEIWVLPALYLTGMPASEDARDAWKSALKLWAAEMLVESQLAGRDLEERIVYRQLVSRLYARLGVTERQNASLASVYVESLAQVLREGEQHPLWSLWQANVDLSDPERTRLQNAEVYALLSYIEDQVGQERLLELLPALAKYSRLSDALSELYGLEQVAFSSGWLSFLEELTGVVTMVQPFPPVIVPPTEPWQPPPTPAPPLLPPGDQIAVNCGGRVWVGDADGADLVPITARGQRFNNVVWSPDGRWLATNWQPRGAQPFGALYLLAADGSGGRLLTNEPALHAWPLAWSPDGREIIFYSLQNVTGNIPKVEIGAVDIESGDVRFLPGLPDLSPDAQHLVYVDVSTEAPMGSAWLAGPEWNNARELAPVAWMWPAEAWSPDSSKIALALAEEYPEESALAIYDLVSDRFSPSLTTAHLTQAFLYAADSVVADGTDFMVLADEPLNTLWLWGWSSDGENLVVSAQTGANLPYGGYPALLMVIPIRAFEGPSLERAAGSLPKFVAFGEVQFIDVSLSPVNPERLTFSWLPEMGRSEGPETYLIDLNAGSVLTKTRGVSARWSPDGQWLAMGRQGNVAIVDEDGQGRFTLAAGTDICYYVAWNPAADLSGLGGASQGDFPVREAWFIGWGEQH